MKQEDKELLFRDLCARLPYKTKIQLTEYSDLTGEKLPSKIKTLDYCMLGRAQAYCKGFRKDKIKPYLFPLSSMTEEQKKYITDRWGINEDFDFEIDPNWGNFSIELGEVVSFINWCYENHFDINSLMLRELAINATGLNIY